MEYIHLILFYLTISFLIMQYKQIEPYFSSVNTFIHEFFHALVAILLGEKARKIYIFEDVSGKAFTTNGNRFKQILVSYAGYTGSSGFALFCFYCLSIEQYAYIFYFFFFSIFISWVFLIRNLYGFLWSFSIVLLLSCILFFNWSFLILHVSIFIASIVLLQSVITSYTILKLSFKQPKGAGDTTNLYEQTFISPRIWGIVFFSQSIFVFFYIFYHFILN